MAFCNDLTNALTCDCENMTYQVRFEGGDMKHLTRKNIASLITQYQAEDCLYQIQKISFGHNLRIYPMETAFVRENYEHHTQQKLRLLSHEYNEKSHLEDFWILAHISTGATVGPITHRDIVQILSG
jgi:hypothetical protein